MLQPFVKSHLGQTLNESQLRNLLGDKLWTPQATFHSVSEVRTWGIEERLKLVATKRFYLGYANVMRFVKEGRDSTLRRALKLKCLRCETSPMKPAGTDYLCGNCKNRYAIDSGIIRTIAQ
jgi:ribosomal protein L44E